MAGLLAWAATLTEPFTTASNYTLSDSGKIEIVNNGTATVARLKVQKPFHLHNTKAKFDTGTYSDTEFNAGDVGSAQSGVKTSDSGLVGYWKLDGATGAIANLATAGLTDSKGTNNGTASNVNGTGMAFAAGKFGNGVTFDGVDDYVGTSLVIDSIVQGTNPFSISLWAKHNDNLSLESVVTNNPGVPGRTYEIHTRNSGLGWAFQRGNTIVTDVGGFSSSDPFRHLVVTYDGSTIRLYRDGVQTASATDTVSISMTLNETIRIGGTGAGYFKGLIDDVGVYNRALTAAEVAAQFQASVAVHMKASASLAPHAPKLAAGYPGLVGYWSMDHASGTVAADLAAANKGTLTNFPASPWAAGINGNGLTFDGVNDFVSVTRTGILNNVFDGSYYTVSMWVKTTSLGSGLPSFWLFDDANIGLQRGALLSGAVRFYRGTSIDSARTVNDNLWHHLCFVYSATNGKIYIDGTQDANGTLTASTGLDANFQLGINPGNGYYSGAMDEVAVFNRALSAGEIGYLAGKKGESATYTSPVMDGEIAAAAWDKFTMGLASVKTTPNFTTVSVETSLGDVVVSIPADLDGDGDLDMIAASGSVYGVNWYANDGTGKFGAAQSIATVASSYGIVAADFDGDGDVDLAGARNAANEIYWVANNGSGGGWTKTVIQSGFTSGYDITAADLDGDGDMDVAATSLGLNEVAWWANNGTGTFGVKQTIQAGFTAASGITTADLDGDGDQDIVAASNTTGNEVACWINNGSGTFGAKITIQSAFTSAQYVTAADLDGDGDQDVVATAYGGNEVARWLNNNGLGTSWSAKLSIDAGFNGVERVAAADLDGDGDKDVVAAGYLANEVAWWANNGAGSFGAKQSIRTGFTNPFGVGVGDLNGDGLVDVAATSYGLADVEAYLNTPWQVTASGTGGYDGRRTPAGDLNGDGSLDVVDYLLRPQTNNGTGTFTTGATMDSTWDNGLGAISLVDIDGDGDLDVVSYNSLYSTTNKEQLAWFANNGSAGGWTKTVVEASYPTGGYQDTSIGVGDMDNDGKMDLVFGSGESGTLFKLTWWKNGGSGATWTRNDIGTTASYISKSIQVADLDRDGNLDIVTGDASNTVGTVRWYRNSPPGTFTQATLLSPGPSGVVRVVDLDRDGYLDIVCAGTGGLVWNQNNGSQVFGATQTIDSSVTVLNGTQYGTVEVADIDGDGDTDIIFYDRSSSTSVSYIFYNDGSQRFTKVPFYSQSSQTSYTITPGDFNGDGLLDFVHLGYTTSLLLQKQLSYAKVQFQARTDSNASPVTSYAGPDGTAKTFYGSGAGIKETNGANLNRYGQYKATLYRNDTTLDPMVKSVQADYTALTYSTANPYVQGNTGTSFAYLTSFAETLSGALPAGTAVKYALSPNNGTYWYYHNGTNWVTSDGTYAQSAAASVISANIAGFDDKAYSDVTLPENSPGTLKFRAFLNSAGSATPQLDNVDVGYETGTITATAPNGAEIWKVGSAKNITWTTTGVVPNDLTLEYTKDDVTYTSIATGVAVAGGIEKDPATITGGVGVWRFNGTTGAIANGATAGLTDSASTNHGTASNVNGTGMAFAAGKWNNAVSFDGVDDYVSVADSANLSITGNVTVSAWVNPSGIGASGFIVDKRDSAGNNGYYLWMNSGSVQGRVQFAIQPSFLGPVVADSTVSLAANTWSYVTGVYDGSNVIVYINGTNVGSTSGSSNPTDGTGPLKIGANRSNGGLWSGLIDDVAVYNRALTAAEIVQLAGEGKSWTIPNDVSNTVKVRARSVGVPSIRDKSDANFTIADLNVTAPNTAVFWKVGTSNNITWTATSYVPDDLILEYTTNGTTYTNIAGSLNHTTGTPYAWTVPTGAISATTKVRARSSSATELVDSSDVNFTAYALAVVAPNGAESWPAGSSQTVSWTHNGIPGTTVKLEYSTDGGTTWNATAIATAVAKSNATGCTAPAGGGCYQWTVPSNLSAQARVRVTDETQAAVTDASDANFTISGTILSVTVPISTDVWPVTTTQTIKWAVNGPIPTGGTVKLSYSADNGATWTDVAGGGTVDATTGTTGFSWPVPLNAASSTAKIKIADNPVWSPDAVDGVSAGYKVSAKVTVNFPNGGEKWAAGNAHNIKWQTTGTLANVDILADLDNNGTFETTLATNQTNNGVYAWTPTGGQATAAAKIRVQSATDATIGDNSDATFKVSAVAVTAPNAAGVRWLAGSAQTITWTSTGVTNVALDYSTDNGTTWTVIAASTLSDGTEPWTVANKTTTQALIRVRDADAATGNEAGDTALAGDNSDNAFAITGTITVTAPTAAGITWASGASQAITWTIAPANANVVPNVKITITDLINAANNKTVIGSTNGQNVAAGSGSYSWSPDFTTTSAKIKVEDAADANSNAQSANAFAIEGIAVSAPAGGESWLVGSAQNIQFSWSGTVTSVKLEYSANNGSTWSTINASWSPPANPATFSWTIPDAIAGGTVKVRVTSNNNAGVVATSNAFTITGALAMTTPATLTVGQSATVSWTKTGTIGTVKVELSPAGTFADTLVTVGTALTGTSTTWTVPDNIGTTGKLKVSDTVAGHPATTGASNAFAIAGDFTFTAPISTTGWGVAESQAVTWTNSGTMGTVKIEYATEADSYVAWTVVTASTTNNGTYTWTPIPDLVGGTRNPPSPISAPTNGKQSFKVRLTDLAHSGAAQVVKTSSAFTVKWYLITFNVQNEDGSFLAALNVSDDATAWSVADASLVSPASTKRQYKYGTIVTSTWSKTNFTAKTDSFTVAGDATRTITLLSENPEPYEISWNPFHNANTDMVTATVFLTRRGQLITDTANLTSGKIYVYSGTTLKATLTGAGPTSATGEYTFSFKAGDYGLTSGNSYFVKTEIVYNGISKYGAGVLPIALPTDTQTVLDRLGKVGDATTTNTLFGKLASLNTNVGAVGDAASANTVFGKIADMKTDLKGAIGVSTDAKGTATVYGKIADLKGVLGASTDTGSTDSVFGQIKKAQANTEVAAQTGILNRDTVVKTGSTAMIRYRTTTGLAPKLTVYDPDGTARISSKTMTEIATTGIYEYAVNFDKGWGTGDFSVLVSESTKSATDSMTMTVLSTDLEAIAKKSSTPGGSTSLAPVLNELQSLRGSLGMMAAQGGLTNMISSMQQQLSALQAQMGLLGVTETSEDAAGQPVTIKGQLGEIAARLKEITGKEGQSLATLYDVSNVAADNVKEMQNKVEQIKQAAQVTQRIVEEGRQKVVVQTWFESGSVILRILVTNPTDLEQVVPVKAYLPKEVREEHVMDKGELELAYDSDRQAYYVTATVTLKPGESAVYGIECEDIWQIPQGEMTRLSDEAQEGAKQLQGTEYADRANLLASQIDLKLAGIFEKQNDPTLTPERHIQVYRENLEIFQQLQVDLTMLKRMVVSIAEPGGKGPAVDFLSKAFSGVTANWGDAQLQSLSMASTWKLIFGLLIFLGILSLAAFLMWQHQAQMAVKADLTALESQHAEGNGPQPL